MAYEENFRRVKSYKPAGLSQCVYWERTDILEVSPEVSYARRIALQYVHTLTVFVKNTGDVRIVAFLQNSPNGVDFVNDKQTLELEPGDMGYLVPYIFSKYIRLAIAGSGHGSVHVWYQMQEYCCCGQSECC